MDGIVTSGRIVHDFTLKEMANNLASEDIKLMLTVESVEHAFMMQELRDAYGRMIVSSWFRTKSFNKSCGGASNSAHLDGRATDIIKIPKSKYSFLVEMWKKICAKHNKVGGVVLYDWGIHFDSHSDKFGYTSFRIDDRRTKK